MYSLDGAVSNPFSWYSRGSTMIFSPRAPPPHWATGKIFFPKFFQNSDPEIREKKKREKSMKNPGKKWDPESRLGNSLDSDPGTPLGTKVLLIVNRTF